MLKERSPHPRDAFIQFDAKVHKYTVIGHSTYAYVSASSVCKPWFGEFPAYAIANRMVRSPKFETDQKYEKYWHHLYMWGGTERRYTPIVVEDIMQQWQEYGKEQCDLGTHMHEAIEDFYNDKPEGIQSRIHDGCTEYQQFMDFHQEVVVARTWRPFRTEWQLWDSDSYIAGTVDMLFIDSDNSIHMVDWKRSKEIKRTGSRAKGICSMFRNCNYDKYSLQLNIYTHILATHYNIHVKTMSLGVFHPTHGGYQMIDIPLLPQTFLIQLFQASKHKRCIA